MIFIDAHVHIYDCFNLDSLFNAAYENFHRATQLHAPVSKTNIFFLLLAEGTSSNFFESLLQNAQNQKTGPNLLTDWLIHPTSEKSSLIIQAKNNTEHSLILAAGRQYITREKLEILALLSDGVIQEGLSLSDSVKAICKINGIPVIPWGVGKWLGRRGGLLKDYLQNIDCNNKKIYLGDNGGRPFFWPPSSHFHIASQKGINNFAGSDPLPLTNEYNKPGSYGVFCEGNIDLETPCRDLKQLLSETDKLHPYGNQESFFRFFLNQLAIRRK